MTGWALGYITKRGHDYGYSESERAEFICNENDGAPCNTCFHDWHERVHGSDCDCWRVDDPLRFDAMLTSMLNDLRDSIAASDVNRAVTQLERLHECFPDLEGVDERIRSGIGNEYVDAVDAMLLKRD